MKYINYLVNKVKCKQILCSTNISHNLNAYTLADSKPFQNSQLILYEKTHYRVMIYMLLEHKSRCEEY